MKAWVIDRIGGPEVCRFAEVPIPEPDEGEIQVKLDGAGLNPVDWKLREGRYPATFGFPAVALREFSGIVTKVGRGVFNARVGDEVYGISRHGAAAEYTVAEETAIGLRPTSLFPPESAVVPLAAMTAWQALFDHGHLGPGQRVLIHAAAGGVGTFAVQLAKWAGAYVTGTARIQNHAILRDLGADTLIDYRRHSFKDAVSNFDLVLHSIGQAELAGSLKVLKPGGRLVSITAEPDGAEAQRQGKIATRFMMKPSSDQLRRLATLIDSGEIHPVIETILPFDEAAEAMKVLEEGHAVGKIGIQVTPSLSKKVETEPGKRYMA